MVQANKYSRSIKEKARELGFFSCGIAPAEYLEEEEPRLQKWLDEGRHGTMQYMENHYHKRLDPSKLVEGAKSVIVLLTNYYPNEQFPDDAAYKISKYAYGKDYHFVLKDRMRRLMEFIRDEIGDSRMRAFVDSAPILERAYAVKAGLGWIGKNTLMITRRHGSFFFISEIITELELDYDQPFGGDYCGDCRRCIDVCPTGAITGRRELDASKCISYLTIELREKIPDQFKGQYDQWIFGCDICQDVCPWNRFSFPHEEKEFLPHPDLLKMSKRDWEELDVEDYRKLFKKSAVKRAKFEGLKGNIAFLRD
ncbi:MAG: tRNA epoxyqueuosine(34) reductase QueG [Bacteroidales bacterium]|nr:tRNA epoxyqueuosine(34) reductase QueG [Bacteroidales bacterium]